MNVDLILETAALPFSVVLAQGSRALFDSARDFDRPGNRDLAPIVEAGLRTAGVRAGDVARIAVDVGPGGTIAVRTGVAYANSLAFALGIRICPFSSFEVIGFEAWKKTRLPVLCTARAPGGNAYVGLFDGRALSAMQYGPIEHVVRETTGGLPAFAVAGFHRKAVLDLAAGPDVVDSGVAAGRAATFLELDDPFTRRRDSLTDFARPLTEASSLFRT